MKASAAVQWWDEGRARWRSRPANKERSYGEPVHGKSRPSKVKNAGERRAVHSALSTYAERGYARDDGGDAGEHLLDAAERHRSLKHERWHHAGPRRDHIASAQARRIRSQGRRFTGPGFFALPAVATRACDESATEFFTASMRREAVRRACVLTIDERVVSYGGRGFYVTLGRDAISGLARDPDFAAAIPVARRASVAAACVAAYRAHLGKRGLTALARMLDAIAHDDGRLADAHAAEWRDRFDKTDELERSLGGQYASRTIGFMARRALEQQPALAREFYAWLDRHAA